jgi:hypothetical protein
MFPNPQDMPIGRPQGPVHEPVAGDVAGEFLFPESAIAFWLCRMLWATVPETAIHKNREFELWKNKIRFAEDFLMPPPAIDFVPTK